MVLCHKYIALVGEFCDEIITLHLYPYTVELWRYQANFIIQGALTVIIYYLFNNNNTYIVLISILLFSSALKNKNISKKKY